MMNKLTTFTAGKLYLMGEYFVVNGDATAIILPLNLGVNITVEQSDKYTIKTAANKSMHEFNLTQDTIIINNIIDCSLRTIFRLLKERGIAVHPIQITIISTLESMANRSYGFGSSGAVTVGIIKTIAQFFDVTLTKEELYKLSIISLQNHLKTSSYGDIAVSVYNKAIQYHVFDKEWFQSISKKTLDELIKLSWPELVINPIDLSLNHYLVINTHKKTSSTKMVETFFNSTPDISYQTNLKMYNDLYNEFIASRNIDLLGVINNLYQIMNEETPFGYMINDYKEIHAIIKEHHGIMKVSGAGGGDNVFALFHNEKSKTECQYDLLKKGYLVFTDIIEKR